MLLHALAIAMALLGGARLPHTESVVVFGSAAPVWRDPATGETTLSREDLDRVPAMTPDESLKVISGFSLFRRSSSRASNPTTHGVTMRGLSASGSSRALIVVDGVQLNDGFGGWVTWERLPQAAIDQISVERGPAGDAFGTDALGGVVKLVTPAVRRNSLAVSSEFASLATRADSVSAGARSRQGNVFGAASWFDSAGFTPLEPAARGVVDVPGDTTWANAYGRAVIGSARRLTIAGWGGRDDRGNGTVLQRNASHGGTGTAAFETVAGGTSLSGRFASSANRYEQTFTAVSANRATERLTSTQHIDTDVTRAIVEAQHAVPRGVFAVRGAISRAGSTLVDVRPATTLSSDLADNSQSISAEVAISPAAPFTLSAGARGEWRAAGLSAALPADKSATVGHAAASWRANNVVTFRGAAATSHRWPTLNELMRDFAAGSTTTVANPNLLPERARSIEGGIDLSRGGQQIAITGFRSVVNDAIANVTTSTVGSVITRQRRNAGEAHSNGVEIDASARASIVRLRVSATILDARFRKSQEAALEGNWLPQVPRGSVAATADVLLPYRHVVSIVIHNTSSQFDDDRNAFRLAAATQVDARVAGKRPFGGRSASLGWQLSIENLADARIETGRTPLVALAQGRAVRFGLSIGF